MLHSFSFFSVPHPFPLLPCKVTVTVCVPTGPEVLRARPLLSLDKLRWPWLFRPLRQGRDSYVSQERKKGQRSIFFSLVIPLTCNKRCVSDENLQKYTSYRKEHFAQSREFDILMWNFIVSISSSSWLCLSLAQPCPHTHTQRLMGAVSVRWKGWKGTRYSGFSLPH